jgi:hypothetical protein
MVRREGEWRVIWSSRGGKQGDTAMPAFFSLALHPAIADIATKYGVRVFAYLDDISISGPPDAAAAAASEIETRLLALGLQLNRQKCEVFGADAETTAAKLGFAPQTSGIKVLGAWIGDAASTALFLRKSLDRHSEFFDRLQALPPDVAFPLLAACAVPKWGFIIRTHDPLLTAAANVEFDAKVRAVFKAIAHIPGDLTPDQLCLLHLPEHLGGLGLTSMALVAKGAYLASVDPASDTQEIRTGQLNRDLLAAHPAIAHHVARCSRSGASCWIRATDVPGDKAGYIGALHMRLMWTPATSKTAVACRCGFVASPSEFETHILGCARTAENFAAQRHRLIQKEAATLAKENGVFAVQEPQLEGLKRADHLFCLATGDLLVDYTVCNEGAKSARHRTHEQLVREKDLRKQRHYAAGHAETPLKTFYLDALGGWSADARAVIKALVEDTTTSTQLATRRISKAMMCASGRLILQARVATRIAVEAQRTLDAWSNKIPAASVATAPFLFAPAPTPSHNTTTDGTSATVANESQSSCEESAPAEHDQKSVNTKKENEQKEQENQTAENMCENPSEKLSEKKKTSGDKENMLWADDVFPLSETDESEEVVMVANSSPPVIHVVPLGKEKTK